MRNYIEVIDDLTEVLNFKSTDEKKAKLNKRVFNMCLTELKEDFKTDVSTKYLMGFVIGDEKQKSNRVNYMLKSIGLKDWFKAEDFYWDLSPVLHIKKDDRINVYSKKMTDDKKEEIFVKSIQMTSHDSNGVKHNCKVGITTHRQIKTISVHTLRV